MLDRSHVKDRVVIGKHSLDCSGDMINARYRDSQSGRYDGVHMYSREGMQAYTRSVSKIILSVLVSNANTAPPPIFSHNTCPQAQYQQRQINTASGHQSARPAYTVPVSNQFDILGNC